MSFRHEDFPCCGCGPEGCINTSLTVKCKDCGKEYHPDQQTEVYCYACQSCNDFAEEDCYDYSDEYDGDCEACVNEEPCDIHDEDENAEHNRNYEHDIMSGIRRMRGE